MGEKRRLVPGTIFRAPNGELYLILDGDRTKIEKLSEYSTRLNKKVRSLLDQYFLAEEPWLAAVYGRFFYAPGHGPRPGPCCAAQSGALKTALEAWRENQKK